MKNLPLLLSALALLAAGHLYYLHFSQQKNDLTIVPPSSAANGVKIAYINGDTLDAQYAWLKQQKETLKKQAEDAEKTLNAKNEALMRDMANLQERFAQGNMTQADAEKEQDKLIQRRDRLADEAMKQEKQITEQQKKAYEDIYSDLEAKLKALSDQIGYDYILSYTRGGQILLANDSLDITKQVLELLNAESKQ